MKRFHVHMHVQNLQASIAFYTRLFSAQPTRVEADYAKWMLEDPRINFAISTRGNAAGLDHLGMQVDSVHELDELKAAAASADQSLIEEGETTCCYSRSEKHWVTDPDGNAWEHFHTLDTIPVFTEKTAADVAQTASDSACCAPAQPQSAIAAQAVGVASVPFVVRKPGTPLSITPVVASCCGPSSDKKTC